MGDIAILIILNIYSDHAPLSKCEFLINFWYDFAILACLWEQAGSWVCGGSWVRRVCTELWLKWGFLRRVFRWELVLESPNTSAVGTLESRRSPREGGPGVCGSEQRQQNNCRAVSQGSAEGEAAELRLRGLDTRHVMFHRKGWAPGCQEHRTMVVHSSYSIMLPTIA